MLTQVYNLIFQSVSGQTISAKNIDETIESLVSKLDKGEFDQVKSACESLLEVGTTDIRIIVFYIYSTMVCFSKTGTVELFQLLNILLSDYLNVVIPNEEMLDEVDKSLVWLFGKIERKLSFYEQKGKAELGEWLEQFDYDSLELIETRAAEFVSVLDQLFENETYNAKPYIQNFRTRLMEITPQPPTEEQTEKPTEPLQENPETVIAPAPAIQPQTVSGTQSYPLQMLLAKITCFQKLVEEQDYIKASIVSMDITQTIENFDPKKFFPELFMPFLKQQIQHADGLRDAQMMSSPDIVQPYIDVYNMDIEEFMKLKTDVLFGDE